MFEKNVATAAYGEAVGGRTGERSLLMADPRTFVVTSPHMTGGDVRAWQRTLKKQFDEWEVAYPLAIDGDYGVITRDASATVLYGLGIRRIAIAHGVTPALRAKVRDGDLSAA